MSGNGESALRVESASTSSLSSGRSRCVLGIGTTTAIGIGRSQRVPDTRIRSAEWTIEACVAQSAAAVVLRDDSIIDPISCGDLVDGRTSRNRFDRPLGESEFAITVDRELIWWSGSGDGARCAVVTADDQIHLLPTAQATEIRSEARDPGDAVVVVNRAFVEAVSDLEFAFETALSGSIPAALGCAWLIELAAGDGAHSPLLAAVIAAEPSY